MGYGAAALIVLAAAATAGLATMLIHGRIGVELRRSHHEVGSVIFLQLGVVFAVLLAFVCNQTLGEYDEAAQAIELECGALHGAAILASTLPPPAAGAVLEAELAYGSSVVGNEWAAMAATRDGSARGRTGVVRMMQAAAGLSLSDRRQLMVQQQILRLLAEAHAQREVRIFQAASGIPGVMWGVLIGLTAVLVLFVSFCGIQQRLVAVTVAVVFAACTVSVLVVVRLLDYPFEGALALPATNFLRTLANIGGLVGMPPAGL